MSTPTLLRVDGELIDINQLVDKIDRLGEGFDAEFALESVLFSNDSETIWYNPYREAA